MPYRNMSIEDLAAHIGMDAREVRKLADKGRIPGQYVGGQWRFNQAQLLEWLQRDMHFLDVRHLHNLERATSDTPDEHSVSNLIAPEGIDLNLPARSRRSVINELVVLAERTGLLYDRPGLLEALLEREEQRSTALAGGFAFPHPRQPLPYATAEPLICIGHVPAGVPFGAPDGRLTDLFVLVVSHDGRQHLHVLARLAMLFASDLADELRACETAARALEVIVEHENSLVDRRRGT